MGLCAVIAACTVAFVGCGWLYLRLDGVGKKETVNSEKTVPYSSVPESVSLRYIFSNRSEAVIYLEFSAGKLTAVLKPDSSAEADYELQPLSGTAAGFIDRLGGIEVSQNGRILRYTGAQAVNLLSDGAVGENELLRAVFDKIALQGITRAQLTFLLQNSRTDLTVPLCYSWPEWLKDICANAEIIQNEEDAD